MEKLDEVIFIPTWQSPFKKKVPIASGQDRIEMISLAIDGIPQFQVTDYEIRKSTLSYTVDTVRHFCRGSPALFFLILSEESAMHFLEWKEAKELMQMTQLLIGTREPFLKLPEALQGGFRKTKGFDISSTEVRHRLKEGQYCGHLIPANVLSLIYKRRLYQE